MAGQSLFKACKIIDLMRASGNADVGGYSIDFELYRQKDIDKNVEAISKGTATKCTFGDANQSKVVLVCDTEITIPAGFNLIPANPKKSLVIVCNTLTNNGTISMTAKGPNVLPHDWFLLGVDDIHDGSISDIVIPAYANNAATSKNVKCNGKNGTNRNCGSGGSGYIHRSNGTFNFRTGSGSAFAGGAATGGVNDEAGSWSPSANLYVDTTYPMRGSRGYGYRCNNDHENTGYGGVGNPAGGNYDSHGRTATPAQKTGVGGRVIIFCNEFINNGTIVTNGVSPNNNTTPDSDWSPTSSGGASGAGAIDIFYTTLITRGTLTAAGGASVGKCGKGGNGSITLLQWSMKNIVKAPQKDFSRANMIYFLQGLADGIRGIRGV